MQITVDELLKTLSDDIPLTVTQKKAIMDTIMDRTVEIDPKALITFEDKAKALKEKIERALGNVLIHYPSGLYNRIMLNCVLSGSSISSLYHGEPVKDYDIWCKDMNVLTSMEKEIPEKYSNQIKEYSERDSYGNLTGKKQNEKIITKNAITMVGEVQLITLSTYDVLRKQFDFIHCMPYYDLKEKKFYISPHQMECIATKKLELNPGGNKPLQWRIEKFKFRGWTF